MTGRPKLPIKTLFLTHAAQLGGAELSLLDLLKNLDRDRIEPLAASLARGPLTERLSECGVDVRILEPPAGALDFRRADFRLARLPAAAMKLAALAPTVRAIGQTTEEFGAEVIHTNSVKAHLLGGWAGKKARIPVIWHIRDYFMEPQMRVLFTFFASRWASGGIIANSDFTAGPFRKFGAATVYNGFGPHPSGGPSRKQLRESLEIADDAPLVCMAGRFDRWKGHAVFLEAARFVLEKKPDVQFMIVGGTVYEDPEYGREIEALVSRDPLKRAVKMTGHREDARALLAAADLYAHPSLSPEPFGRGIAEAMLAGVPVIASRAGGPAEIIRDGATGFLFRPGDAQALAAAILNALDSPEELRQMSENARKWAEETLSIQKYAEGVARAIEKAVA